MMCFESHLFSGYRINMTALSGKYKRVFVGRVLKKVDEDGDEIKGLVRYANSILLYSGVQGKCCSR